MKRITWVECPGCKMYSDQKVIRSERNSKFITSSYILKNLIILVSLISLYLYLRKPSKKISSKVKGEDKIYTKNTNEDYFDKFRNKEKLKTKAEQILEKDGKD